MVESSITQASPISSQPGPRDVVEAFLRVTVDTPDLQRARLHVTKRSVDWHGVEVQVLPTGSTYTLGAVEADGLGRRIAVRVKRPAREGAAMEAMTVPMIVVEEEGQWKIDLPATMERLTEGLAEGMNKAGEVLASVTTGMSEALARGLEGMTSPTPRSVPAKAAKKAKPKAKKVVKKVVGKKPAAARKPAKKVVAKVRKVAVKKPPAKGKKVAKKKVAKKAVRKVAKKAARKRRH